MADYAFRSISEQQKIQSMWEARASAKDIADEMELSLSSVYTELRRGYDGTRLPDKRRRMIVALIALDLAFFLGYLSGCWMQRARNPQIVPSTALAAMVARVERTETQNPLDGNGSHRGHPTAHRAGPLP